MFVRHLIGKYRRKKTFTKSSLILGLFFYIDHFHKINKRIENIIDIEKYLDSFMELYEWNPNLAWGEIKSKIKADVLIANQSFKNNDEKIFVFFTKTDSRTYSVTDFITEDIELNKVVTFYC